MGYTAHYTLLTTHYTYTWYTTHYTHTLHTVDYTVKYCPHDTVDTLTPSQGDTVTVWLKYRKIHSWVSVRTKYRTESNACKI